MIYTLYDNHFWYDLNKFIVRILEQQTVERDAGCLLCTPNREAIQIVGSLAKDGYQMGNTWISWL
jgi:hypothetical protein